jgi:sulfatase modifying factor 1
MAVYYAPRCKSQAALLALVLLMVLQGDVRSQVTMSWSQVGSPGNPAGMYGNGAVPYSYQIGTYDVTVSQYVAFLNTKDPTGANTLGLYNDQMGEGQSLMGQITYDAGAVDGSKYTIDAGDDDHPVNNITWFEALRFANWMNNGQGNASTETGSYTLGQLGPGGVPLDVSSITRNAGASIVLPSPSEWYKAACFNPATQTFFQYSTASDTLPLATGPTSTPNAANYNGAVGALTDVGAYSGTVSPFGAYGMGGNVIQWTDAQSQQWAYSFGSAFYSPADYMVGASASAWGPPVPTNQQGIGFRLARVPEPSGFVLTVLALVAFIAVRRNRRHAVAAT